MILLSRYWLVESTGANLVSISSKYIDIYSIHYLYSNDTQLHPHSSFTLYHEFFNIIIIIIITEHSNFIRINLWYINFILPHILLEIISK